VTIEKNQQFGIKQN